MNNSLLLVKLSIDINLLIKTAEKSYVNSQHAAALIYNDNILAMNVNKFIKTILIKNGESIEKYYKTIHAEINLNYPRNEVRGKDIVVIRINKNLALKNSRPCSMCIEKMKKLGIRKVYYSNNDGEMICEDVKTMTSEHISAGNKVLARKNIKC